ncbi:MAG: dUTP diphosphatase [Mameliella sp.]|nr:dUTP diphosphatase [Mameliella sp.]
MTTKKSNPVVKMVLAEGVEQPVRGSERAAAIDLRANIEAPGPIPPGETRFIPTGVFLDMSADPTLAALVLPRSGLGAKTGLVLGNTVGLIDNDYRGELLIAAWNRNGETRRVGMGTVKNENIIIEPGMKLAQLVFLNFAFPEIEVVEELSESERGAGGFGSTGAQ